MHRSSPGRGYDESTRAEHALRRHVRHRERHPEARQGRGVLAAAPATGTDVVVREHRQAARAAEALPDGEGVGACAEQQGPARQSAGRVAVRRDAEERDAARGGGEVERAATRGTTATEGAGEA